MIAKKPNIKLTRRQVKTCNAFGRNASRIISNYVLGEL